MKQQINPKVSKRLKIIKLTYYSEINEMEYQKTTRRTNTTKSWFLRKINKIDKIPTILAKSKRKKAMVKSLSNEKEDITADEIDIQKIVQKYFGHLYANKVNDLEEMGPF